MKKIILFFCLLCAYSLFGQTTIPEWKLKLQQAKHDTTRLKCYTQIAFGFRPTNLDSAFFYLKKSENLSRSVQHHKQTVEFLLELGNYQSDKGNHLVAAQTFKKASDLAAKIKYVEREIYIQSRFALNFSSRGNYHQGAKLYLLLLNKFKTMNSADSALKFRMYHNLVIIYLEIEDYDKALIYAEKKQSLIRTGIERVVYYEQKGMVLLKMKRYSEAISYVKKAINLAIITKSVRFQVIATANLGEIYRLNKQYQQAIFYHLQTISVAQQNGFERESMVAKNNLGATYLAMGAYNKALPFFQKNVPYFIKTDQTYELTKSLNYLSDAYRGLGDYKKAYLNYVAFTKTRSEITGKEKQKLIAELNTQYEVAEQQQKIATQELQNKVQQESIRVEKRQNLVLIALFVLALLFLFVALWNFYQQRKLSQVLSLQKALVEKQAIELANTNQSKDKLFAILAHDLRSPIANLVNSLDLWKDHTVNTQITPYFQQVYHQLANVQLILNNLLQWSSLQLKNEKPHFQVVSLKQLMAFAAKQFEITALEKKITILNNIADTYVWADENQLQIVLRNILSNALKYTHEGGYIKITSLESSDQVMLSIRDTGVGILSDMIKGVFQYPVSQNGTKGEKGTGIGLSLAKELVEKNKGTITLKSEYNKGTEVCISLIKTSVQ